MAPRLTKTCVLLISIYTYAWAVRCLSSTPPPPTPDPFLASTLSPVSSTMPLHTGPSPRKATAGAACVSSGAPRLQLRASTIVSCSQRQHESIRSSTVERKDISRRRRLLVRNARLSRRAPRLTAVPEAKVAEHSLEAVEAGGRGVGHPHPGRGEGTDGAEPQELLAELIIPVDVSEEYRREEPHAVVAGDNGCGARDGEGCLLQ